MRSRGLALLLLVSCAPARPPGPTEASPGIVFPHHVAEGRGGGPPAITPPAAPPSSAAPVATEAKAASAPRPSPPDPEPLALREQYELELAYDAGHIEVAAMRALKFKTPVVTARRIGRFALELWIGHELIDRVRFDFPLLPLEEKKPGEKQPLHSPPAFGGKQEATVLVPASPRVRRAVVLDRATGEETELPWPPVAAPRSSAAPAPSSAAPAPSSGAPTPSSAAPSAAPSAPARPR